MLFYGFDPIYMAIMLIGLALGLATQSYINSSFKKWSKVPMTNGLSGAEAARAMLDREGLQQVAIQQVGGELSDNFDPRSNTLNLSADVFTGRSVSATAVACHEAGHAVQHAKGYLPAKLRSAIVPVANLGSRLWGILLILGFVFRAAGSFSGYFFDAAIICFSFAVIFQIVTLPVEFNASGRALTNIQAFAASPGTREYAGSKTVLRAAALTYVAGALVSVMQLLYFIGLRNRN